MNRAEEGKRNIEALEQQYQGRAVKIYNAVLTHCILETSTGFQIFNSYGYAGTKPTLSEAVTEYDRQEIGNSAYETLHDC